MDQINNIKGLIKDGETAKALSLLTTLMESTPVDNDTYYFLMGNAHRKDGNMKLALNNYLKAIEINPQSPALQAKEALLDILNFFNKDMYNQ